MEIGNLKEGMVIKNYKVLCEVLGWKPTNGKGKILQLKDLERFCIYERDYQRIIIKEVFETPFLKEDNKRNTGNFKRYKELNIEKSKWNNTGVYYIIKDNDIYIGSTKKGYRERFMEHYNGYDERMRHTYELLQSGATYNILYDMTGIEDVELVRMIENEFINYFNKYTEYNVINKISGWNLNKVKYKSLNVKIQEDRYEQAIQLLIDNGLVDLEENETLTSNYILNNMIDNFDIKNVPF